MSYDKAQICQNGHVITADLGRLPGDGGEKFCSKCGASTMMKCECGEPIRGRYWRSSSQTPPYFRPAYCTNCGKAFPWTQAAIQAAVDFSREVELSEMDRTELPQLIENLVRDTPGTTVAATRLKRAFEGAGTATVAGFKTILTEVVSEAAKKILWP